MARRSAEQRRRERGLGIFGHVLGCSSKEWELKGGVNASTQHENVIQEVAMYRSPWIGKMSDLVIMTTEPRLLNFHRCKVQQIS